MPTAILAYGYVISHLDRDAIEDLLLSAAHVEGRIQEASTESSLDEPHQRDQGYQLALIGLSVKDFGDGYHGGVILASRVEAVGPDDPFKAVQRATADDEPLTWAIRVLGRPEEGDPQWLLALDSA
jgi:hypothetical protein